MPWCQAFSVTKGQLKQMQTQNIPFTERKEKLPTTLKYGAYITHLMHVTKSTGYSSFSKYILNIWLPKTINCIFYLPLHHTKSWPLRVRIESSHGNYREHPFRDVFFFLHTLTYEDQAPHERVQQEHETRHQMNQVQCAQSTKCGTITSGSGDVFKCHKWTVPVWLLSCYTNQPSWHVFLKTTGILTYLVWTEQPISNSNYEDHSQVLEKQLHRQESFHLLAVYNT